MSSHAELAIRSRRAAFNHCLAAADLAGIGPILAQQVLMVTGTDSGVIAGRKAQLLAWKREFAAQDRCIYTRTPDHVLVSGVEPLAMEDGHWTGVSALSGATLASGRYSAKWRETAAEWVIEAEIYITLG
ncbi:nuclear transport factor 2 family protein [Sphingopyxis yananensis]|jgi:hypothetical protein|uniref:nuclear transport factor 2 family protein n=1 Tax=Sphingopyxis yananensis TaxID=2886687 RepID=UPI001D10B7BA|nr:nuclear transport factor 2 family protein [Sphingopyxis yananensis]MCC2602509.1 nuclear transport factor 2 family protein [Sphingopyxis yananensis]